MDIENLYVVKRTILDLKNPAEPSYDVTLPATFTDLSAAKKMARTVLTQAGYDVEFFSVYDVNNGSAGWKHGDGVIVYAEGPSGEIFKVEIDTMPNVSKLEPAKNGRIQRPLYHVLQTVIDYDSDRSGSKRYTTVEGTHTVRGLAQSQALTVLLDEDVKKKDFVEYDEYSDGTEGPFGKDTIVHAVKEGGQNVLVSVISQE